MLVVEDDQATRALNPRSVGPLPRHDDTGARRFKERLLDLAEIRAGERVLDLDCGTGTLVIRAWQAAAREIARVLTPGGSVLIAYFGRPATRSREGSP